MKKALLLIIALWIPSSYVLGLTPASAQASSRNLVVDIQLDVRPGAVQIKWTVSELVEDIIFIIERRKGSDSYELIGGVLSGQTLEYFMVDEEPANDGQVYYRVKQLRKDRKREISYSEEAILEWLPNNTPLVFPNPVSDAINTRIPTLEEGNVFFRITNMEGLELLAVRQRIQPMRVYSFDLATFEAGIYHLHISAGNHYWVAKFLKQ